MKIQAVLSVAVLAVFAGSPAIAQQSVETTEHDATSTEGAAAQADAAAAPAATANADAAKSEATDANGKWKGPRTEAEKVLFAQAAGYKLVNKDGRELFCKKEMVTGSRLATRTRCLTLAQIDAERNAAKDMLDDMNRRNVDIPQP